MKKITLLLSLLLTVAYTFAQLPVSQTPENKNVVLEEFTGIHCGFCPDGHRIAQQIYDAHPDDVVLINIHTGSFATPGAGEPDFRTPFGQALASQSQLAGYPAGTVNRHYFGHSQSGSPSGATALGRGQWTTDSNTILSQSSYCNIALEASVDSQTREMTVNVEVYYTADSPVSSNFINVVLLQDNIEGPQSGASSNPGQVLPNGNYNHTHMLRHMITGQWGDEVTTTSQGTLVQKQYTYTLPADINGVPLEFGDLHIAGFVAEGHQEIITGSHGPVTYSNIPYNINAGIISVNVNDNICDSNDLNPKVSIQNSGSQDITDLEFEYNVNGGTNQTYTWNGTINSLGSKTIDLPAINFSVNQTNTLNVTITTVNGSTDENAGDNTMSANFNKTTNEGTGTDYVVTIVQDQYGTESTWVIVDESDNVIANGGPYSNLGASGTQTHTHNVTINNSGCYKFHMLDSYGDGMCCTYGNGYYKLEQADGTLILQGDGQFLSEDMQSFIIEATGSVDDAMFSELKIYPNPTEGVFLIDNATGMNLQIFDIKANLIFEKTDLSNQEEIQLNLPNGVYFAKFAKNNQVGVRKIVISK